MSSKVHEAIKQVAIDGYQDWFKKKYNKVDDTLIVKAEIVDELNDITFNFKNTSILNKKIEMYIQMPLELVCDPNFSASNYISGFVEREMEEIIKENKNA